MGLGFFMLAGCASAPVQETRRYFWPQLPERPRIEWLKSYRSSEDFPKSGMKGLVTDILGEENVVTIDRALDIVVNSRNQVYIADPGQQNVVIFDLAAYKVSQLARRDTKEENLEQPCSLALDEQENLYVSDMATKKIYHFDLVNKKTVSFSVVPNLESVGGMVVDKKNKRLVIVDTKGHKVAFFSLQGKFLSSFGAKGNEDGQFLYPYPVRINSRNEILVGDTMNARVQIFDENGKYLRKFGERGDAPQDFQVMKGIAVDGEDNIYITDGKGHKVVIYSREGDFLMTFGGLFSSILSGKEAMGGFVLPQGIIIDQTNKLYIVDQMNHRFQVFQYISDDFLQKNPIKGYNPNATPKLKDK
jgi:DNA-binding beta-propeller fold protein YncE